MGAFRIIFALLVCFCSLHNAQVVKESPTIELRQGRLKGILETSTDGREFYSYLGIPFAQPPVNNLRFEEPVKHEKWEGVLEANRMPEMCLQADFLGVTLGHWNPTGSEDCLYLNVFTPKAAANLPVMVYIHGGAFISGAAAIYQPHVLLNEDIVLVVIQYRLGIFGFLSTEDGFMPGNMGLKDQRMALQWVQENIRNFGGNPDKVTIFGESAGGASVHLQMLSPGSKGLFVGVIAQSGTALNSFAYSDQHLNYAKIFGGNVGCELKENSETFKECLKQINGTLLVNEMVARFAVGIFPFINVPRVDGDFLPDNPETLIKTGRYNPVNLIIGNTRNEGGLFNALVLANPETTKKFAGDFPTYGPLALTIEDEENASNLSAIILDYYLKNKTLAMNPVDELTEMLGDAIVTIQSDLSSVLHAQDKDLNLFLYQLDHRGQRSFLDAVDVGLPKHYIVHIDDLFYLFTGGPWFPLPLEREEDIELRRKVTKLWTNFAKYGNPTPLGSFDFNWNPATKAAFQHLSIKPIPRMENYSRRENLYLWMTLNTRQMNILSRKGKEAWN